MYYLKRNDASKKLYRIEETNILELLYEYRNLFEQYSIETRESDNEKRVLAGIDMYFNLFSDRYDFEKDKVNYDVFFLDPKNVILTGQGDINKTVCS